MINEYCANAYCCEDLSLIENYQLAVNDNTQTWHCHHRGEILPCGRFSPNDLNKFGLYYNRPASELIFLTKAQHTRLHKSGVLSGPLSEDHKKAISEALRGIPKSEEHRAKLSKKILQFTKSGEFIKEWQSMNEAERELGIAHTNISICCNGKRKSAGSYVWRYA